MNEFLNSWFFTGVIYDSFVVYDLLCLAMLSSCALHYRSNSAIIAAVSFSLIVIMGAIDAFLTLHLMIQKALYAPPFMIGAIFVNRKIALAFSLFILIQIVYMVENLLFLTNISAITSYYPVLCFISVILITARISAEGDQNGGNIGTGIVDIYRRIHSASIIHDQKAHEKKPH